MAATRRGPAAVAVVAALALLAGCGGSPGGGTAAGRGGARGGTTTTAAPVAAVASPSGGDDVLAATGTTAAAPDGASPTASRPTATDVPTTSGGGRPSTTAAVEPAAPDLDADDSLDGFATADRSAPAGTDGTALLRAVRVGHHDGFDRVVFEFAGDVRPGYRVGWNEGPTRADGSGQVVAVAGDATLEVVLQPASGVDMETGKPVYVGPDRVAVGRSDGVLQELVRTGDFEAVLSWAVGADRVRAFRVSTLAGPARVVVDVRAA